MCLLAWGGTAAAGGLPFSPCLSGKSKLPGCVQKNHGKELVPYKAKVYKDHGLKDVLTPLGRRARGFYLTAYYLHKVGPKLAVEAMKRAHMNAVVIDVKDDLGQILWPSKVELSRGLQNHLIPNPKETFKIFRDAGIYVIARVVCFKDSRLPYKRPDLSVRWAPKGTRLFSAGANWMDSYSPEVQDYIIDLALELKELGVDEVQLDYIRFPKGWAGKNGLWLHQDSRDRATLIEQFLDRIDRALDLPLSVDVYGLTTLVDGDPRRLGQTMERMAVHVEAISPMMYANGMDTYFKNNKVTERVYHLLHCGLWRARQKASAIVLRPFLQSYPNNVESFFGPDFIKKQITISEQAGCEGFLFWNSTMKNGVAFRAMRDMGKAYFEQFGTRTEQFKEAKNHPGQWCPAKGLVFDKPGSSEK